MPTAKFRTNAFAWAIFLGAFLLFLAQPIQARFILPWFGGGPGVWTACLLFFQCILLVGYAYAHASSRWLPIRTQALVHLAIIGLSLPFLPAIPATAWQPSSAADVTGRVVMLLAATVGLPAIALAATAPLLQGWFTRVRREAGEDSLHESQGSFSPYRLYALSNAGSLGALVAYPFLVEPLLARQTQAWLWALGFVLYAVAAAIAARQFWRATPREAAASDAADAGPEQAGSLSNVILWLLLSACGSALLAALTARLSQDVAVVPFLWVLPLAIYMLTFIVCFERPGWYRRTAFTLTLT